MEGSAIAKRGASCNLQFALAAGAVLFLRRRRVRS